MNPKRDLLAELELTMVPSMARPPEPGSEGPPGGYPESAESGTYRRHFWCRTKQHEVEVEFVTVPRLLWPGRITGVKRCTAFDEPTDIACGRHCLDVYFRYQWPDSLRVADRRPPAP
ncbi:MAG TPA: hypothetical protein VL086_15895 [Candidatus Nitrosotalea sp.]|nr:hypothetical protein [Candidatus Nitrosotalea sp.]